MPVGTLGEARAIAQDVAAVMDAVVSATDADADDALAAGQRDDAVALRRRVEELARQAARLRDI